MFAKKRLFGLYFDLPYIIVEDKYEIDSDFNKEARLVYFLRRTSHVIYY